MKKVLLHICCGICSSWAIEKLKIDGFQVCGFFYNPNIQPEEEYFKRLAVAQKVAEFHRIELLAGKYDPDKWQQEVKGRENDPEGGKRCLVCFHFRLKETFRKAVELGIEHFTTTLTISPHKNFEVIKNIGSSLSPEGFLAYNFKKEDGFKKSNKFCREHELYRQNYCGCLYSRISL
ncbi:MAG: epoxyqueuosine reductase QueH [Candidatus Omnitrophica bacterium]|nr:epoxyqueuosine reductase QueH [Candidatus Omnitrophota bacterium]